MKIALVILIMLASYLIGQSIKDRVKNEYDFIVYLKNFTIFLKSNFSMFKVDIVQIIDDFILLQDNDINGGNSIYKASCNSYKEFNKIFCKENGVYKIIKSEIEKNNNINEDSFVIFNYLESLGSNSYEFEENKINSFLIFLETKQKEYFDNIKTKGVLSQKVIISIGLIVSILIWWVYGRFNFI